MLFDFSPNPSDNLYERVQTTEYVCMASSFETLSLWKKWNKECGHQWKEQPDGRMLTIGRFNDMPITLTLQWAEVSGVIVMFVEPTSRVVDHEMVETWLQEHCNGARTDNSAFIQKSDAMNFHPVKPVRKLTNTKHVSLDVWNTLITGNPEFSTARIATIIDHWSLPSDTYHIGLVKQAYTDTKHTLDWLAEHHGTAYSCLDAYGLLSSKLGVNDSNRTSLEQLRLKVEQDFLNHPPLIIEGVVESLNALRENGYTLSIGSNSNFISGTTMMPWLQSVLGHFNFGIFSDIEQVAKPNPLFFAQVADCAKNKCNVKNASDIIHVGDHIVCDLVGARNCDLTAELVSKDHPLHQAVATILKGTK